MYYNDIDTDVESYSNNLFTGDWYDYFADTVLICNWGDKRIPRSGNLDIGLESFKPSFRYLDNGWRGYLEEKESDDPEPDPWWK